MKKIYIIIFSLFLINCSSMNVKEEKIQMPTVQNKNNKNNLSKVAETKIRIGEKYGIIFDFFHGNNGSYFIVVSSKDNKIDLSSYDILLNINDTTSKTSPEVLALAIEDEQVLSGYGQVREGLTDFELVLNPIDPSINKKIIFNFQVNINYF